MERDQVGEHRPGQIEHVVAAPGDRDPREGAHRHRHRQLGHGPVGPDELPQSRGGHWIQVLDGRGFRRPQRAGQQLRGGGDPHPAEVRIRDPFTPHSLGTRDAPKIRRRRHSREHLLPLAARHPAHPVPQAVQVPQIVPALLVELPTPLRTGAREAKHQHADGGGREKPTEQPRHRAVGASDVEEGHGAHAQHHRQGDKHLHDAGTAATTLAGQAWRRLEKDFVFEGLDAHRPGLARSTGAPRRHFDASPHRHF